MNYFLDACAIIARFKGEKEGPTVESIIDRARRGEVKLYMSIVNLLEVRYGFLRLRRCPCSRRFLCYQR
jgi:predicted nucleic acid-binding protein